MRKSRWPTYVQIALCALLPMRLQAASAPQTSAPQSSAAAKGAAQAPPQSSVLKGAQVIRILDETVDWYRVLGTQQQQATQPSDLLIVYANRQTADRVVSLAFDMARANAELLSSEESAAPSVAASSAATDSFSQKQAQLDTEYQRIKQEIAAARQQLAAGGKGHQDLPAKISELQGELAMVDARRNLLDTMSEFVNESDPKAANANALKGQIDAIAATVPGAGTTVVTPARTPSASGAAVPATAAPAAAATPLTPSAPSASSRPGIWDLFREVLRQHTKLKTIEGIEKRTQTLADTFKKISAAPRAQLQAYSAQGDSLAAQADNASGETLKSLRDQFDTLAWLVKQTSEVLLPLGKEQVLLERYQHNLASWHTSVEKQYREAWATLGVQLAIVAAILVVVFALGEVWRRAVIRYVHDAHRRYQMLLVRTIVMYAVVAVVVGLSFVTELTTFVTFAGLLSAGLAVALQSVLVSVVGYFFLIGKYGIRVGDRIQIGTVVGEVLDIGLVRLHLMELNQAGPLGSTGRVVAFPNLIVFQTTGGLFKQASGNDLSWHETTVALPDGADYPAVKEKLLAAVVAATGKPGSGDADSVARVNLRLNSGHMEALIHYPVIPKEAAEVDERVAQAVLKALPQKP